jgi:uncharacterized protein (TIGR03435 family)
MPMAPGQIPGPPGAVGIPVGQAGASPEMSGPMMAPESPIAGVFDALRKQLGLRLDKTKVPTQQIVIDHIEKISDN